MGFAIHQHELAIGIHVPPTPAGPPGTSLSTQSLYVVPGHWLWVPCFMCGICTGHLVYIC